MQVERVAVGTIAPIPLKEWAPKINRGGLGECCRQAILSVAKPTTPDGIVVECECMTVVEKKYGVWEWKEYKTRLVKNSSLLPEKYFRYELECDRCGWKGKAKNVQLAFELSEQHEEDCR